MSLLVETTELMMFENGSSVLDWKIALLSGHMERLWLYFVMGERNFLRTNFLFFTCEITVTFKNGDSVGKETATQAALLVEWKPV